MKASVVDFFFFSLYNRIMKKPYEYKEEFQLKYCDVDFKDEMKPSVALSLMEEVACGSADELGFGYAFIKPRGYAFMVTNICVEYVKPVLLGETVVARTWPLKPSFVIFGREYRFSAPTGETLLNASSRWCLMDMKTGKPARSSVIEGQDYSAYNDERTIENPEWKIPDFTIDEGEVRFCMTVANSEYDHNMHVNNTRYADYCFNCFTVAELTAWKLKSFSLAYVKQCKEGDCLRFVRKKAEDGSYLVHGFNANGEVVVRSRIVFLEEVFS